ncbi:MAG: TetR/AcrR family transcriptional regulator [Candidatus Dormibacteria bacterium]
MTVGAAPDAGDARVARGRRTRDAIVAATLALIETGDAAPTARRIAARAGVSERALFVHFPDLEALHAAVAEGHLAMVTAGAVEVDPRLPLPLRLGRFCGQRAALLERVTPLRRVALRRQGSAALRESRRRWSALARQEVSRVFAAELRATSRPQVTLAAAQAVTGWGAWDELRTEQELSVEGAAAAMELALERVLAISRQR